MNDYPNRKHPAHHPVFETHNRSRIIFITVCSNKRKSIFTKPGVHDVVKNAWNVADAWKVGHYCIMPDHIHFFSTPVGHEYPPLKKWVQFWKATASKQWPNRLDQPIWQADFWDTQLRRSDSYTEKWNYVRNNPVRKGLCQQPDEWPYQGSMAPLFWHD